MVDPFIQWPPERLRLIGFTAAITGASVLLTLPLSELDTTPRQRLVLALSVGASSYYMTDQYPILLTTVTFASLGLALAIPLILTFRVAHDTIRN